MNDSTKRRGASISISVLLLFALLQYCYYYKSASKSFAPRVSSSVLEVLEAIDPTPKNASTTPLLSCHCHPSHPLDQCPQKTRHVFVTPSQFWNHPRCTHSLTSNIAFFHAGKGGGGTIGSILEHNRISGPSVAVAHPAPDRNITQRMKGNGIDILILNVRDPVDRLVSAFQWRLKVLCYTSERSPLEHCTDVSHGSNEGKRGGGVESYVLRGMFQSDPNVLAESLCEDSYYFHSRQQYVRFIGHSTPLVEWMRDFIGLYSVRHGEEFNVKQFVVVPMKWQERGGTSRFEHHVEELVMELLRTNYGSDLAQTIIEQKPLELSINLVEKERKRHSSASFFYRDTHSSVISPLGECCLTRYLEKYYRLIRAMLHRGNTSDDDVTDGGLGDVVRSLENVRPIVSTACSWGSTEQQHLCREDLVSILERRMHYLDRSRGQCSNNYQSWQNKTFI